MLSDYHLQCRAAVAAIIEAERALGTPPAGLLKVRSVKEQDEFDPSLTDGPFCSVYLQGQPQPIGGTFRRDDWRFPIVVGLSSTGAMNGNKNGPHPASFLNVIHDLFHNRRPAGVPSGVMRCEIDSQPVTVEEKNFEHLTTATTVVLVARLSRRQ